MFNDVVGVTHKYDSAIIYSVVLVLSYQTSLRHTVQFALQLTAVNQLRSKTNHKPIKRLVLE